MKVQIINSQFVKEYTGKYGTLYQHEIVYKVGDETKVAQYSSKTQDQKNLVAGSEADVTVETRTGQHGSWEIIKPAQKKQGYSSYGQQQNREQARYSGFAMSYAKDLVIAGKVELDDMPKYTKAMFKLMVELDQTT